MKPEQIDKLIESAKEKVFLATCDLQLAIQGGDANSIVAKAQAQSLEDLLSTILRLRRAPRKVDR